MDLVSLPQPAFHERMLAMAWEDLGASMELYKQGFYPQAMFLLQQAVEKSIKSVGICITAITAEQAKSARHVGHVSVRVFEHTALKFGSEIERVQRMAENAPEMQEIMEVTKFDFSTLQTQIAQVVGFFRDCATHIDTNRDLCEEDLLNILLYYHETEDELDTATRRLEEVEITEAEIEQIKQQTLEMMGAVLEVVSDHGAEIVKGIVQLYDLLADKEFLQFTFEPVCCIMSASVGLFCLSLITQPHAITARYPEGDFDPLEFYNERRPVVQALPSLYRIAEQSIGQIEDLYDFIEYEGDADD